MEIYRGEQSKTVKKESGTEITYHLFDEYEINVNYIPPGSTQDWHYHKVKEEVILVTRGSINVEWKEGDEIFASKLSEGDLVRVENTIHRFSNPYSDPCSLVCFKLVLSGESKRNILAGDKYKG